MKRIEILEKVEGEVFLHYHYRQGRIDHVEIEFPNYRGMERLLVGKPLLDALVITPRVCGICGHSHLIATARALESMASMEIGEKAREIRRITLSCELIQNHFKWLYLVILPLLEELGFPKVPPFQGLQGANIAGKIIALFGGQYPHTSYAIAGGVVCDPTSLDIYRASILVEELHRLYEGEVQRGGEPLFDGKLLLNRIARFLLDHGVAELGKGWGRFLHLGASEAIERGERREASTEKIEEEPSRLGYATNLLYEGKYWEVGPLARRLSDPLVAQLIEEFGDGLLSRIVARVSEIGWLLEEVRESLGKIDLSQPSTLPFPTGIGGYGEGIVEAPRGSLIHRIWARDGIIERYTIWTPTQFNLANGTRENPSVAQKGIRGVKEGTVAALIFRSFDICSVCTTH
ncbi:MAG: hydrogenase [Epsilonproteobacteria bacterium]|nr:hydrogenase [Campylobacterota bacterium]NPA56356.1 hydrogenase [Campylobacterota bacterium]